MILHLQEKFLQKKKTLAVAESCTGGLIAHLITQKPGSSGYFLGSMVTYSIELKQSILGVKRSTLEKKGVVSQEVVLEMAQGLFHISQADFVVATSGIAGPSGGSFKQPIGTVWIAIGERGSKITTHLLSLQGGRSSIIEQASWAALRYLLEAILR